MEFNQEINGIPVRASYSAYEADRIFCPLLKKLTELQKSNGSRIIVMLSAPPATGKSTLAAYLKYLSETETGLLPLTVLGMDGFHYPQSYLTSHTVIRGNREMTLKDIKGAPETFNLEELLIGINRIRNGEEYFWPEYDRKIHDPVPGKSAVGGNMILIEGNYLLLNQSGWEKVSSFADFTIRIDASTSDLLERLTERKLRQGWSFEKARQFVLSSDFVNAETVLKESKDADCILQWNAQSGFSLLKM